MQPLCLNSQLKFIFRWTHLMGLWIPERQSRRRVPTPWETFTLAYTAFAFFSVMSIVLGAVRDLSRVLELSVPIVVSLMYLLMMAKTVYIWLGKSKLLALMDAMDDAIAFAPFAQHQKVVVDFICGNVRKTVLGLISLGTAVYVATLVAFYFFSFLPTEFKEDQVVAGFKAKNWTLLENVGFGLHCILTLIMPTKMLLMDTLMIQCHYFVVQQLKLLNRIYNQPCSFNEKKKFCFNCGKESDCDYFDNWVRMFNKVKRIHVEVNKFFGPYCIIYVGCVMFLLCIITFTAAKFPSSLLATAMALVAVLFIIQIFAFCKSGQSVRDAAERLTDTICTGPRCNLRLAEGLNYLVALDLQRSFTVRGGPFFNVNLEFFASIIGVVFTYFVVLVQIKE
ncbi:uncharacterized protein LOC132196165 [Neocloeon triangulifer]|uniref:uncharacterized protein LOC132196165 n=1 Tax=Neocloeon triangulifer TaxID=2078957 RepID=UPI00286F02E1|nr:uncharacterized protein LOC132196165 [Neocloeon triangulifer]